MIRLFEMNIVSNNIDRYRLEHGDGYYVSFNKIEELFDSVPKTKMIGISANELDYFHFIAGYESFKIMKIELKNNFPEYFI